VPTFVKNVFKFISSAGYGFTETHFRNVTATNPSLTALLDFNDANIIPLRAGLLGEDCSCVGQRVSYRIPNGIASQGRRRLFPGTSGQPGAASYLSLAVVFINSDGTKKKICHMRGFWDALESDEVYNPPPAVAALWDPRFIAWKDSLVANGYGWPTRDTANAPKGTVSTYVIGADGRVTFTVPLNAQLTALADTVQSVTFSRLNSSKSTLNRALVCDILSGVSIRTRDPVACGPFTGAGNYSVRLTTFVGYAATGSQSIGERRMGKPLDRLPGRRSAKAKF